MPPAPGAYDSGKGTDTAWGPSGDRTAFTRTDEVALTSSLRTSSTSGDVAVRTSSIFEAEFAAPDWQPTSLYVRPAGASPLRISLVPAFSACTAPNREHGPPLAFAPAPRRYPARPT